MDKKEEEKRREERGEGFPLSTLRIRIRMGRAYKTGFHPYHGRQVPDYAYKELYHTDAGDFEAEDWMKLAREAVKREGKEELLKQLKSYCSRRCAWLHKEEEVEEYALDCLASEAYLHWKDFGEKAESDNGYDNEG